MRNEAARSASGKRSLEGNKCNGKEYERNSGSNADERTGCSS